jgi:CBS domain-containing protein
MLTPEEFLADAAGQKMPLLELLAPFGHSVRSPRAMLDVTCALESAGLTTDPPLNLVEDRRQVLRIVPIPQGPPDIGAQDETLSAPAEDVPDEDIPVQASMLVGDLPSAVAGVRDVSLDDTMAYAETLMLMDRYSQLAVVHDGQLRGVVTWESISAAKALGKLELRAALDPKPEMVQADDDLLKQVPRIRTSGFALVVGGNHLPIGIVTTADLADQFVNLANPFVVISEIERRLRRIIGAVCTIEQIKKKAKYKKKTHSADDLTFGDYQTIFADPALWSLFDWKIHQTVFVEKLDRVRDIRNEVMHFKPEPLSTENAAALSTFLNFVTWLDQP